MNKANRPRVWQIVAFFGTIALLAYVFLDWPTVPPPVEADMSGYGRQ